MLTRFSFFYLFILIASFSACTSEAVVTDVANDTDSTSTTLVAPDRGNFFKDEEQHLLRNYFDQELIAELSENMYAFQDASSDKELAVAFAAGELLQAKLEKAMSANLEAYKASQALAVLDTVMQFYAASCMAECTEFTYVYDIKALQKKASSTKGNSDDSFAALLEMACGDYDSRVSMHYNFFVLMWDYGGGSALGNDICRKFLQQSWTHIQTTPLFRKQVNTLREACLSDMAHGMYMATKEEVVQELKAILEAKTLGTEEQPRVAQILADVEAETFNGHKIQFACGAPDNNCDFGG